MKLKISLIILALLIFGMNFVYADTPAPKSSYMKIAGPRTVFVMSIDHDKDPIYNFKGEAFPKSGLYIIDSHQLNPLWTVDFYCYKSQAYFIENPDYMILRKGMYSSNGLGQRAFTIYKNGEEMKSFKVSDFIRKPESFELSSASHYSWGGSYEIDGNYLKISTREGRKFIIDVENGAIVKKARSQSDNKGNNIVAIIGGVVFLISLIGLFIYIKKR